MDAVQQLEVALLGSPASSLIDMLTDRLQPSTILTTQTVQSPHINTTTPMAPPPTYAPMVGLTSSPSTLTLSVVKTIEPPTKCHCMVPTLLPSSTKSSPLPAAPPSPGSSVELFLMVVIPELAIPPEAMPEQINQLGGMKNYQCWLCTFAHTNRDCMLMHIWKHLNIIIGCPICRKGFQNVVSLWKHGKTAHAV